MHQRSALIFCAFFEGLFHADLPDPQAQEDTAAHSACHDCVSRCQERLSTSSYSLLQQQDDELFEQIKTRTENYSDDLKQAIAEESTRNVKPTTPLSVTVSGREGQKYSFICGSYDLVAYVHQRPVYKHRQTAPKGYVEYAGKDVYIHHNELSASWVITTELAVRDVIAFCVDSADEVVETKLNWYVKSHQGYTLDPAL